jgi:hypothetical protein
MYILIEEKKTKKDNWDVNKVYKDLKGRSTFLFSLSFSGFNSDFFVVLFKGGQIFSGF